jgi:uncharacterized membrane protein YcjF (UPF0283 family)
MKSTLAIGATLFVIGVLVGIAQLWFEPWSAETFIKIEMTVGGLIAILVVVWFVVRESKDYKAIKSGDRLDQ